jgi:uncharacterized protein (UPF0276 family)
LRQGRRRQPHAQAGLIDLDERQATGAMITRDDRLATIPARAGIGLRAPHVVEVMATRPAIAFLEVHTENYLGGGPAVAALERLRSEYPVSLHGVGLSLGGADPLDDRHLLRVKGLVERIQPALVSEHLAWSVGGGAYLNHLLPLPYDAVRLEATSRRIERIQETLGRRILVENPARYLRFRGSPIPEPEFLLELSRRTGCGILLDVNNVYVSARNFDEDPGEYLDAMKAGPIGEIHLAGHATNDADGRAILIDDHGSRVDGAVWDLYRTALMQIGPIPTLVEWDTNLPELAVLLGEAEQAERSLQAGQSGEDRVVAA